MEIRPHRQTLTKSGVSAAQGPRLSVSLRDRPTISTPPLIRASTGRVQEIANLQPLPGKEGDGRGGGELGGRGRESAGV